MDWKLKLKSIVTNDKTDTSIDNSQITAEKAIKIVDDFMLLLNESRKQYGFNNSQIDRTNDETQDLLHWTELSNLDAVKGFKFIREITKVRRDRRYYKDQNVILELILQYLDDDYRIKENIKTLLDKMNGKQETLKNRVYQPKVRTDLDFPNKAV